MKIVDALLRPSIRVSNGYRWLVRDEMFVIGGEFIVYEHVPYSRSSLEIYRGTDEDKAVEMLLDDEDEE